MPVPDFQALMLPVLDATGDGREHRHRDDPDEDYFEGETMSAETAP